MFRQKIKQYLTPAKIGAILVLLLLVLVRQAAPVSSQTVAEGYEYDASLQRGMIVSISSENAAKVEPSLATNLENIHGVVIDANDTPVTLVGEGQQTFVATNGRFEVLVSDQNGSIEAGDPISVSSLAGIGMRADRTQAVIIGKAANSFEQSTIVGRSQVDHSDGQTQTVNFGRVLVDIGVASNPNGQPEQNDLTDFFANVGETIAQKPVSPLRLYLSLAVVLATTAVAGSMLYGGIRSSIVAIGRNPLSRHSIVRSMTQVTLTSFIIFISGFGAVYLLLRL